MTISIVGHSLENGTVGFHAAKERIAAWAQQAANVPTRVAVVHEKGTLYPANQASPFLGLAHSFNVFRRQPILALQTGPKVFGLGCIRILSAPLAKALVAPIPVGLPILTGRLVPAVFAVGAKILTRLGEPFEGKGVAALRTSLHVFSMSYQRGNTQRRADLPCHADVLLELANR